MAPIWVVRQVAALTAQVSASSAWCHAFFSSQWRQLWELGTREKPGGSKHTRLNLQMKPWNQMKFMKWRYEEAEVRFFFFKTFQIHVPLLTCPVRQWWKQPERGRRFLARDLETRTTNLQKQRRYRKNPETPHWKPVHSDFLASCFEMDARRSGMFQLPACQRRKLPFC